MHSANKHPIHMSKRGYFILVVISLVLCIYYFVPLEYSDFPRIHFSIIPNGTSLISEIFMDTPNAHSQKNGSDAKPIGQDSLSQTVHSKLKEMGIESTEGKQFQSPYIITPKIYDLLSETSVLLSSKVKKIISCYNCPSWFTSYSFNLHNIDFQRCPYSQCEVDLDGTHKSTADVVLLHMRGGNPLRRPPARPLGQIWVMCVWESPPHFGYPEPYDSWRNQFNWTFNYRLDSDIFAPNNLLAWRDRNQLLSDEEYVAIAKEKTKAAAWFVSNCNTQSGREKYVKELQKYIDVDIYGRCGPYKCPKSKGDECERMLTKDYKFYLSFENSMCRDYVTEKFFRNFALRSFIVPVVRGGFNYSAYVPSDGYVDAGQFKNAKALGLYLKQLGNDHLTYARMLKEKDKLVALNRKFDWCDICEKVHSDEIKVIPDIKKWSHEGMCFQTNDIS